MNSACQLCVEYKESNNNEIIRSAEKVVRPWPDRPDRRLRPCTVYIKFTVVPYSSLWNLAGTRECL